MLQAVSWFNRITLCLILLSLTVHAGLRIVTTTSENSDVEGSFAYTLENAPSGDTIIFEIPDSNEIEVDRTVILSKDLTILGRNRITDEIMTLNHVSLHVDSGRVQVSDLVFSGMFEGSDPVLQSKGAFTIVSLNNVEIIGSYYYDYDNMIYPAIMNKDSATVNLFACTIRGCLGGGVGNDKGIMNIENSVIKDNTSYSYEMGGIGNSKGVMTIRNSTISQNRIGRRGYEGGWTGGAGISNHNGILSVFNSTISANSVSNALTWSIYDPSAAAFGGGIMNYQAPNCSMPAVLSIFNSTISGNSAFSSSKLRNVTAEVYGGGAYLDGRSYVTNCTFFNNEVQGQENYRAYGPEIYLKREARLFNNIISTEYREYSVASVDKLIGIGNYTSDKKDKLYVIDSAIIKNGFASYEMFGSDSVFLGNNGGITHTVALGSESHMVGRGVRTGYYSKDTVFNGLSAELHIPVYFSGENWISAENEILGSDTEIMELTSDQRGITRSEQPCVGAFELSEDDLVDIASGTFLHTKPGFESDIKGGKLHITVRSQSEFRLELFSLSGRKIYTSVHSLVPAKNSITLPYIAQGAAVCRLISSQGVMTKRIISVQNSEY